jgi:hypothetical protein
MPVLLVLEGWYGMPLPHHQRQRHGVQVLPDPQQVYPLARDVLRILGHAASTATPVLQILCSWSLVGRVLPCSPAVLLELLSVCVEAGNNLSSTVVGLGVSAGILGRRQWAAYSGTGCIHGMLQTLMHALVSVTRVVRLGD